VADSCEQSNEPSCSKKDEEFLLASREGLYSMELFR